MLTLNNLFDLLHCDIGLPLVDNISSWLQRKRNFMRKKRRNIMRTLKGTQMDQNPRKRRKNLHRKVFQHHGLKEKTAKRKRKEITWKRRLNAWWKKHSWIMVCFNSFFVWFRNIDIFSTYCYPQIKHSIQKSPNKLFFRTFSHRQETILLYHGKLFRWNRRWKLHSGRSGCCEILFCWWCYE